MNISSKGKRSEIMCNILSVQAIFNPPTAIRGGIPVLFPQVCDFPISDVFFVIEWYNNVMLFCINAVQ